MHVGAETTGTRSSTNGCTGTRGSLGTAGSVEGSFVPRIYRPYGYLNSDAGWPSSVPRTTGTRRPLAIAFVRITSLVVAIRRTDINMVSTGTLIGLDRIDL